MAPAGLCRRLLCCLVVGSLLAVAVPASAAPPPRPLCDACGDTFEETAEYQDVSLTVERSTATIAVHENGTATWVVQNHLTGDGERLRTNESLLRSIGDRAMWDAEFLGANVSADGVVTLRYREAGFAESAAGGTLRSGEFTESYGYRNLAGLGADRLTVVAPDGMRVGWTVPGASVSEDGTRMTLTSLDRGGFVTFVPRDSAFGPVTSLLAVGSLVGPVFFLNAAVQLALPAAVFGLLVSALGGGLSWLDPDVSDYGDRAGPALAVVGGLVTALSLAAGGVSILGGSAAPVVGVGITFALFGLALSRPAVREHLSYPMMVGLGVLGVVSAAGFTLIAARLLNQNGLTLAFLTSLPALVSLFALFPTGYALGADRRRLAVVTIVASVVLALLPTASLFSPAVGNGMLIYLFLGLSAVGALVLGSPLVVVGVVLGRGDDGKRAIR
ncbi:hypothetical protein [Haloarcula amylovorans]|uniref:hypothetical protein n=1 Tax=Haloarcula amylovorans TaxID=2562280 RepID=UPI001076B729|nr:hypothetical protein [Halomicroarcula amylolytica]